MNIYKVCLIETLEEIEVIYTSEEKAYDTCVDFINSRWYAGKMIFSDTETQFESVGESFLNELASTFEKNPDDYGVSEICWVTNINLLD